MVPTCPLEAASLISAAAHRVRPVRAGCSFRAHPGFWLRDQYSPVVRNQQYPPSQICMLIPAPAGRPAMHYDCMQ